jgi:N-acyl-D-amino-acid deacylase
MAYDLLIKNGRVIDGSGIPAFRGDVGIKGGKIVEIGKLSGAATRTIDAEGRAVAPGFIDNHCHYDAQVTWDPLCTFSPEHGATTVIFGNCSLSLAPVRKGTEERLAEFLSYVEAIPMEVLRTVEFDWQTTGQYMDRLEKRLGINIGALIGHTAVRHYVMGDECQKPGVPITRSRRCRMSSATACGRARSASRCHASRAIMTRKASTSPPCGPTKRKFLRLATYCAK